MPLNTDATNVKKLETRAVTPIAIRVAGRPESPVEASGVNCHHSVGCGDEHKDLAALRPVLELDPGSGTFG